MLDKYLEVEESREWGAKKKKPRKRQRNTEMKGFKLTYPWNRNKTHRHKEQTCGCQGGGSERGIDW